MNTVDITMRFFIMGTFFIFFVFEGILLGYKILKLYANSSQKSPDWDDIWELFGNSMGRLLIGIYSIMIFITVPLICLYHLLNLFLK